MTHYISGWGFGPVYFLGDLSPLNNERLHQTLMEIGLDGHFLKWQLSFLILLLSEWFSKWNEIKDFQCKAAMGKLFQKTWHDDLRKAHLASHSCRPVHQMREVLPYLMDVSRKQLQSHPQAWWGSQRKEVKKSVTQTLDKRKAWI